MDTDSQGEAGHTAQTEQPKPEGDWKFEPDDAKATEAAETTQDKRAVTWSASEFIAHEKSIGWYALLVLAAIALAVLTYFLSSHDILSVVVIIIVAIIFGAIAGRKPRELHYALDSRGVSVGQAFRPYSEFKSFAKVEEGAVTAIIFLPLKRFIPPLSVYVGQDMEDVVTQAIADHLPFDQEHGYDAVDRFIQRIRF